jgi:hypothetical protein
MTSLLLAAALAAGPDSLPPPATPSVVRDTVYIERVVPALNPAAAVPPAEARGGWVRQAVGIAGMGTGAYLFVDGANSRETELFVNDLGEVDARKQSWHGRMTVGAVVFAAGILLLAVK